MAGAIARLQERFHPAYTVLVGHSGGAAIAGDLLARAPSAVNGALLVSCPCDLAGRVPSSVPVSVLVGEKDDIAPPEMSKRYVEALRKRLRFVRLTLAPGLGHELLLEPVAYEELQRLVESLRGAG